MKRLIIPIIILVLLSSAAALGAKLTPEEEINISVFKNASPSVVNITTTTLMRDFFSVYPQKGSGSGSIITQDGYVVTNFHVVEDTSEITIVMNDGKKFRAKFIGADPDSDIAIIKIIAEKHGSFKALEFGNSEGLQVGQKVFAIGNPFGLNSTLTAGIISATGRPLTTEHGRVIEDVIQTDAPINPGNSGGPLLDTEGKMIGINSAIFTPSGGNIGIGFAIPINTAKSVIPDLIKYGRTRKPWMGIVGLPLWENLAKAIGLPVNRGILVSEVVTGSPAFKAGIRGGNNPVSVSGTDIYLGGDVILEVNGVKVAYMQDVMKILSAKKTNDYVSIKLLRDNKIIEVKMRVELRQ
ncbi:MAG: trypsin-like peptidase domain-containing protein [Nitrospirae bacterium]|nr:trypsin-like peptidase domain-containing protein [Nitrospirota bacterium]MBF0535702.1 trypsin-like peptidase domain-containing protein [Nitrospirota bacterium]MBF0617527.1 trypsin-like peptidase domain-containing protein [Nitrospirota bacterium]